MVDRTLYSGIPVRIRIVKVYWRLTSILFIGISFLTGCKNELPKDEYVAWVTDYDNGLHVKKQSGDIIFDLQYKPDELISLERGSDSQDADSALQYFTLKLSTPTGHDVLQYNTSGFAAFQQNLYYYSYLFQEDISLEQNGKSHRCVLYHFERPLGAGNARVFNLGFDMSILPDTDFTLVIQSERINSFPIRLKISNHNIPTLQI